MTESNNIPEALPSMMDQAKESICRIEESAIRIHGIVNGVVKPNVVRTNSRRRDDFQQAHIKMWLAIAVAALIITLGCMTTYIMYEMHTSTAIVELSTKISNLETQVRQLHTSTVQPSQNLDLKQ